MFKCGSKTVQVTNFLFTKQVTNFKDVSLFFRPQGKKGVKEIEGLVASDVPQAGTESFPYLP